jgi:hypothetical protein
MQEENKPGEITTYNDPETVCCKNCTHNFIGKFCPQCGQSKKEFDRPLKFFLVDFAGNLFAFDTRLWQSIKHILFCPGRMETNFIKGKRIRYMPPFRMYVFVSFFFFLTLSWATGKSISKNKSDRQFLNGEAIADSIYNDIREKYPEISFSQQRFSNHIHFTTNDTIKITEVTTAPAYLPQHPKISEKMEHIIENPKMYMDRFFKYASWSLFLLMPFYGFLLWLNFWKSKQNYIGHFLLSVNQHIFIFVILMIILLIDLALPSKSIHPEKYLLYLFPVYAITGALRLYERHWLKTGIRLLVLICIYLFVTTIVTAFIVYLSFTS